MIYELFCVLLHFNLKNIFIIMKRLTTILLLIFLSLTSMSAKGKVKNVILMIPDGTSLASVSSARWFQRYLEPEKTTLNIDPYLCGTILTYCSDAPIGDSAPTTSCYMTGYPSLVDWVSTYPISYPEKDLIPVDSTKAYQPLMTVLEAARITQNKSTGLVFTCEFPHATPADCAAHSYRRGFYNWIAPQMVHNGLDIVIGGGVKILRDEDKTYLKNKGYGLFLNEIDSMRTYKGNRMWALFQDYDMSFDIDRNPAEEPSLAEMTEVAISKLSKNKKGFFLMVEGSKVDWAAHANDARAIISDVLAFDKACGVALDFAKKDGNTVVVIVPDHGNSGISLGCETCPDYATLSKDKLFKRVSEYKSSVSAIVKKMKKSEPDKIRGIIAEHTGLHLTDSLFNEILKCGDYKLSSLTDTERMKGTSLSKTVAKILNDSTCFGFTTHGHTGEEVFLAVYDPRPAKRMTGHHTNIELNTYLRSSLGLKQSLESLTDAHFAKHTDIFPAGTFRVDTTVVRDTTDKYKYEVNALLTVENKEKGNWLEIRPNTNIVKLNGREIELNSVIIYVDKNNTFYLPRTLGKLLAEEDKFKRTL
jgi:alkaline phosphatase